MLAGQRKAAYTSTTKALHWLMAFSIIGLFAFGFYVKNMPLSPQKLQYLSYHKFMSSAKGFQTVLFGILPIPDLLSKNREMGQLLSTVHLALNLILAAVVVGHILAALKHHFIERDEILIRMLPSRRSDT